MDGTPFGRYRLIELLGRGGMGEVWRAHDTETDRIVAIKVLPAHLSEDEEFQQRFRREAQIAARLKSPHVIPIHNYGEIDARLYLDMRLIEGPDLGTALADGPLDPARAVHIVGQVAKALHAAHKVGLLHRDIKPSNILLDDDDFAYLIDFGIARVLNETRMTKSSNAIGTFQYIAPERLGIGTDEDARADIYSLACVLYECLTGSPPFPGETMAYLVAAHLNSPPPRPSIKQPKVPRQVDEVIARGMAKDPDERYATTVELANAAREAITVPIEQAAPTPAQPPAKPRPVPTPTYAHARSQPAPSPWARPGAGRAAEPLALNMARFSLPAPPNQRTAWPMPPPKAAPPAPTRASRISRRTKIALIAGVFAVVAVIVAAVGISALGKDESEASSSSTASGPSYGSQIELPFTDLYIPKSVAVDSAGNVYVADSGKNRVLKLAAGSSTQTELPFTGLNQPAGVAVDSTGNVYVTDSGKNRVLKLAVGSSTQTELPFTGLNRPHAVAVDNTGNVYVSGFDTNQIVLKLMAGSSTPTALPLTGLNGTWGVAVDNTGNVYVADAGNSRVLKLAAGSSTQTELPLTGLSRPWGVAVDSSGILYVVDAGNSRVLKLAGSSTTTELPFTGLGQPNGVTVDNTGNVYVADTDNNRVVKLAAG